MQLIPQLRLAVPTVAFLLFFVLIVGCDSSNKPPPAIAVEQLPAALEKAFAKAKPDTKELATQIINAVQAKDYSKAYQQIQILSSKPGLTKQQMSVTVSSLVTVNNSLQSAQAAGDAKAAETIQLYRKNK